MTDRLVRTIRTTTHILLAMFCTLSMGFAIPLSAAEQAAPAAMANPGAYVLGPGDKLRISVFGEPRFDGEYVVTGGGSISFPLIGNVPAHGQTVEALQDAIRTKLAAGYLKDPRVAAEVLNYRPFYILGEINKPGEYPYSVGLTVQQAVAMAGGFSYRANTRRVFIKRALDTMEKPVQIKGVQPVAIGPGDTLRIGERFF